MRTLIIITVFIGISINLNAQTQWTKYANNPVHGWGSQPTVIFENDTFKMWFAYGIVDNLPPDSLKIVVGYATSTDGIHWVDYSNNPVFDAASDSSWDSRVHDTPFVLHDSTGYKMWYTGSDHIGYPWADSLVMVIGYATSPDGIHWTKHPEPVLTKGPTGSWDRLWLESPTVIYENGTYKMWYTGESTETGASISQVGYATSPDGVNWTKNPNNPVLKIDQINDHVVGIGSVIKVDSIYYMFYNGATQYDAADNKLDSATVNLAYSYDGINWNKYYANPLMTPFSPSIDNDTISPWAPTVIFENDTFMMWYEGIGLAVSPKTFTNISVLQKEKINLNIYPNPANQFVTIKFDNPKHTKYNLNIYNYLGKKIKTITDISSDKITLNLENFSNGIYLIKLENNQEIIATKKLIINK